MRRMYLGSIVSVLMGLVLLVACSKDHTSTDETSGGASVPVTVAYVVQKDVPVQINSIGNVEAFSKVLVKSQVKGGLSEVYFNEGQEVKKGELIFLIDPRPYIAVLSQAKANLAKDTAMANDAKLTARRYGELFKRGVVSKEQYDNNTTNFEALKATVSADESAVENAKLQLEFCHIRSPIDGRIGKLMVNRGNVVKENDTVLAVINQIRPIYVEFSVPEQMLPAIRRSMTTENDLPVMASIPSDNGSIPIVRSGGTQLNASAGDVKQNSASGRLTFIDNEVDVTTGTILLKAVFSNEDEGLWPGQFVNVVLTLDTQRNAVLVPNSAIQEGQRGNYVYVVKPDLSVESRPIIVSRRLERESVIEKGVDPGQRVVTSGQLNLAPGMRIEIKNETETDAQLNSSIVNP
ncbi:MAG: efflux RND transporter periplasmic adaptor subunit [Thermodesulfobacteriota bacterium]